MTASARLPGPPLAGKVALVTGGSRGIGRAVSRRLAADGAEVFVHYGQDEAAAAETVSAIEDGGGTATAISADLARPDAVDTLFAALSAAGMTSLDILVNNAAIIATEPIDELSVEEVDRVLAVNVKAPLFIIQRALPLLPDGASVITISSLVTRTAPPEVAYVMSKGAVDVMGRSLAPTLGRRGITVNAVAPGLTDTDMMAEAINAGDTRERAAAATAMGRVGRPEDIADVVSYLASDRARWVTGQVLDASGGLFLRPRF